MLADQGKIYQRILLAIFLIKIKAVGSNWHYMICIYKDIGYIQTI